MRATQARHPDGVWAVRRFRPTVLVDTEEEGFPEDAWIGGKVRVGGAELAVFAPTVRCAMVTRTQPALDRDLDIVKTVNRHHDSNLGVYAVVKQPGRVAVGDRVEAVDPASHSRAMS